MAKRSIRIIIAAEGPDFQVQFRRGDGYALYVAAEYCGSFDTLTAALAERDRIRYEQLRRA